MDWLYGHDDGDDGDEVELDEDAAAVDPTLEGGSRPAVLARTATAQLAQAAQISKKEIWRALGLTRQGLAAVYSRAPPETVLRATRIHLALELEVQRRSASPARP